MNPPDLKEKDLKDINSALHSLSELNAELDKAEQAGEDVADYRQRAKHQQARLEAIKATYFPGHP